jgi:hypothetical protein
VLKRWRGAMAEEMAAEGGEEARRKVEGIEKEGKDVTWLSEGKGWDEGGQKLFGADRFCAILFKA